MKKILIISTIVVALFIVVSLSYSRAKNYPAQSHNNINQAPIIDNQFPEQEEMVDSQGGVDVSVEEIKRENNQTILFLGINNHVEDYSRVDLKEQSELAGVKPIKYTVDDSATGGHHVASELVFPGNLSGPLIIRLTDKLVFNIDIK